MSVTSVGGRGWGVQIFTLIHFNTPFRSCFTKLEKNVINTIVRTVIGNDCIL